MGIPVVLLVFFSEVHLLPTGTGHPVDFLAPGILALAVMGTALVSLASPPASSAATACSNGWAPRRSAGPVCWAPRSAILVVEVIQAALLVAVGSGSAGTRAAGRAGRGRGGPRRLRLGTAAFGGIGLLMAGTLKAEVNLAAANGLLVLLLLGGMLVPLSNSRAGWRRAKLLPAAALADGLHGAGRGPPCRLGRWLVLVVWAVAAPVVAGLASAGSELAGGGQTDRGAAPRGAGGQDGVQHQAEEPPNRVAARCNWDWVTTPMAQHPTLGVDEEGLRQAVEGVLAAGHVEGPVDTDRVGDRTAVRRGGRCPAGR